MFSVWLGIGIGIEHMAGRVVHRSSVTRAGGHRGRGPGRGKPTRTCWSRSATGRPRHRTDRAAANRGRAHHASGVPTRLLTPPTTSFWSARPQASASSGAARAHNLTRFFANHNHGVEWGCASKRRVPPPTTPRLVAWAFMTLRCASPFSRCCGKVAIRAACADDVRPCREEGVGIVERIASRKVVTSRLPVGVAR